MTLTDETFVRELTTRAEQVAPPMSLDPARVLHAGRRRRRRGQAARGAATALAVTVVGVGTAQLAGTDVLAYVAGRGDPSVGPAQTVTVGGLQITSALGTTPVETSLGTLGDLGVPVDPAEPDGARYVLEHVVLDPADLDPARPPEVMVETELSVSAYPMEVPLEYLNVRTYDPTTGEVGDPVIAGWLHEEADLVSVGPGGVVHGDALLALGVTAPSTQPELYVGGEVARVWLPTFELPQVPEGVFFTRVSGDGVPESWPSVSVYPEDRVMLQLNE